MKWHEHIADAALSAWVKTKVFLEDNRGASGIEYAVIAAMVAVIIIGLSSTVSTPLKTLFTNIGTSLSNSVK